MATIATSLMPPIVPGYQTMDLYNFARTSHTATSTRQGGAAKCGQPNGFETNISYRAERPKEKAAAESLQQSLAKVGIKLTLKPLPDRRLHQAVRRQAGLRARRTSSASSSTAGVLTGPTASASCSQIVDSRVIRPAGNTNLGIKLPEVDKLIDQAIDENDTAKREAIWGQIDKIGHGAGPGHPRCLAEVAALPPATPSRTCSSTTATRYYDYASTGVAKP